MPRLTVRPITAVLVSFALVLASACVTAAAQTAAAPAAEAAPTSPFVCDVNNPQYIYSLGTANYTVNQVDTATGSETVAATFTASVNLNGLAISQDGLQAWAVQATPPSSNGTLGSPTIYEYDTTSGTTTSYTGPSMSATTTAGNIVMGGIDPANGLYYFAITSGTNTDVYAFDTGAVSGNPHAITAASGTDNRVAVLATGTDSNGGSRANGDLVFDSVGRLVYVASSGGGATNSNVLNIVNTPLPGTANATAFTPKTIANLTPNNSAFNGITFGGDGLLYVEYATGVSGTPYAIAQLNPDTGATLATHNLSLGKQSAAVDLASCTYNNALTARKNILNRYKASDQFSVNIALQGGGTLVGNTGTTTGSSTGLQTDPSEIAGPLIGLSPTTYVVSESGANGANLANYVSTYACTDTLDSGWAGVSGTGTSFSLVYPSPPTPAGRNIVCTFTNGTLDTTKSIVSVNGSPATSSTVIHSGDVVKYRITATNTGFGATPTTLTETVPAHTTYTGDPSEGWACGNVIAGSTCTQTLTPPNGGNASATFTVTVGSLGSSVTSLDNSVTTSFGNCSGCSVSNPVGGTYTVSKSVSESTAQPGDTVTYTLTINGVGPAVSGASVSDDLGGVLDDAAWGSAAASSGTASFNSATKTLTWTGGIPAGGSVTVTYRVVVDDPDNGDGSLANAVSPGPNGSCVSPGACHTTTPVAGSYTISKTASESSAQPGDVVTYTVTVHGQGAPVSGASFADDLSGVLDDASYNHDASATAGTVGYANQAISWSGALTAGETVTVTYSVTVDNPDLGDGSLGNAVMPGGNGGSCATPSACSTTTPVVGSFTVTKSAGATTVQPGDTLTYTVTVHGQGAPVAGATFTDDLSGVLDDATYNHDASATAGTVGYANQTITWSGALTAGQTVTVTYTVTVDNPDTGDGSLVNAVTPGSGGTCPGASDCTTTTPVLGGYTVRKAATPSSTAPGGTVSYTVTVTGTGAPVHAASFADDLSDVLDDAAYNNDASATSGTATFANGTIDWTGDLAAGQAVTVTYTVTVDNPDAGNASLVNAITPGTNGGSCATVLACTTTTPVVGSFTVSKSADPSGHAVAPGDHVIYTLTVHAGPARVTGATLSDDLSNVLDDAAYDGNAVATSGTVSYARPALTWTGDLTANQTVTISYSVLVRDPDNGDASLVNAVTPGSGGTCTAPGCATTTPVRGTFTVTKSADPRSGTTVSPADTISYTLRVTGHGALVPSASITDDLRDVLDDATYDRDAAASSGAVRVSGSNLRWTGSLRAGQTATVTYSVTVNDPDEGDGTITNAVTPGPSGSCGSTCGTTHTVLGSFTVAKSAAPKSGTTVDPGQRISYTLTVTGGAAPTADASLTDDLSDVLDDATGPSNLTASDGTVAVHGTTLTWSTPRLAAGQVVKIRYEVTVDKPDTGNGTLVNVVRADSGGSCGTDAGCRTVNPVHGSYVVAKTADAAAQVAPGTVITYTITVTGGDAPARDASFTDDLHSVLRAANWTGTLAATAGSADYAGGVISWHIGELTADETVTVTYSVTAKQTPQPILTKNLVVPGADGAHASGSCPTNRSCLVAITVTRHPKVGLAGTGTDSARYLTLAGLLIGLGLLLILIARRRRS